MPRASRPGPRPRGIWANEAIKSGSDILLSIFEGLLGIGPGTIGSGVGET